MSRRYPVLRGLLGLAAWAIGCCNSAFASAAPPLSPAAPRPPLAVSGPLTLEQARQALLERHPALAAARHSIEAQEALRRQAGRPANPVLFGEIEEFAGSHAYQGWNNAAARAGLSREFATAGKVARAVQLADLEVRESQRASQALQTELELDLEQRFYNVHFRQETLTLRQERLRLLAEADAIIRNRIEAGSGSSLESLKNQTEQANAALAVQRAERELDAARLNLAAAWGDRHLQAPSVKAPAHHLPNVGFDQLLALLPETPAWQKTRLEQARAAAETALEESRATPDIELEAGIQHFREDGSWALFAGFSVPLPLFDRNQDNIAAARARERQVLAESAAAELELHDALRNAWQGWQAAQAALHALEISIIPAARRYHDAVSTAWQAGEADILELFDARHNWLEQRQEALLLQEECENARIDVLRRLGHLNLDHLTQEKE